MMTLGIGNLGMLLALFALAIPVLLHLLQRRRFDVLDWGAMQFLPDSVASQRKRWLDELLLMLLRMALIALVVLALATPFSRSSFFGLFDTGESRAVVIVLDGSYSMNARHADQATPWREAIQAAKALLAEASDDARFAVLIARQPPVFVREDFAAVGDLNERLDALAPPTGNPDIALALAEAWKHLQTNSKAAVKEIVVITDRQRFGWADHGSLSALDDLGDRWHADTRRAKEEGVAVPSLRVITVGAVLPASPRNFALAPLSVARSVVRVGQKVSFESALHLEGVGKSPPRATTVSINGTEIRKLAVPDSVGLKQGQIPLRFQHRFEHEGTHLVSLAIDPASTEDALPADNVQHAIIEVVKHLPMMIVEGDRQPSAESGSFVLRSALATKSSSPRVVVYDAWQSLGSDPPAVVLLADVPRLDAPRMEEITRFVADGGGLLVFVGPRMSKERAFWNDAAYADGDGWLPAKLGAVRSAPEGVRPDPRSFQHPALAFFQATADPAFNDVRFNQWSATESRPENQASPIALLTNGEPFLIEKPFKQGRVILCSVPLDRRWGSTLPGAWECPILLHHLVDHLAGARLAPALLRNGAPIRLAASTKKITLTTPEHAAKVLDVKSWPWTFSDTGATGAYRVEMREAPGRSGEAERERWFVVPPDLRESDLERCTDADWAKVRDRLPIVWYAESADAPSLAIDEPRRHDLWWVLLSAVVLFLCIEVWMTRRMVRARGG